MGKNQLVSLIIMHSVASFDHCLPHFSGSFDHLELFANKGKKNRKKFQLVVRR
jgi:hypothetical protein